MLRSAKKNLGRDSKQLCLDIEFVVIGGGLAGVCAAIAAAREGLSVCLIQDRPVLGGNASSEVRLWSLGATSHMGNNNRFSREGGIIDEIMLENLYKNPEGNTLILDTVLLEKVLFEENITLLLNTSVYSTTKKDFETIDFVEAFCSQNSTHYKVSGEIFCDASGDGIVAFQSGAPFRIGAESRDEFNELLAPEVEETELLGHSIYFYSKEVDKPVEFIPPNFASLDGVTKDRINRISPNDMGPRLWWIEFGGSLDTIHNSEEIKMQLWKVVYGVWDYIKNSGKFENVENLTLEWVGTIPGKRESRRFDGHYMLTQQDIVEQRTFEDAISYGGWSIDHHPGDGVYSEKAPCRQYHSKGTYQIPLRSFIPIGIKNLFVVGRLISASHIAFGSTRVMCTSAHGGQAIGLTSAYCLRSNISIEDTLDTNHLSNIQQKLNLLGHFIPGVPIDEEQNLLIDAEIDASSEYELGKLDSNGEWEAISSPSCQMLAIEKNTPFSISILLRAQQRTSLTIQLRISEKKHNFSPEIILEEKSITLDVGETNKTINFESTFDEERYVFVCFEENAHVDIKTTNTRVSGIVSLFNTKNISVSNNGAQVVDPNLGIDSFEFWIPKRRPGGKNFAIETSPSMNCFKALNVCNGYTRPFIKPNAWVASLDDENPRLEVKWNTQKSIKHITIHFDTDFDHPLESSLMGHPERTIPFCVRDFSILDANGEVICSKSKNYQSVCHFSLSSPINTNELTFQFHQEHKHIPVSVFSIFVS